MNLELQYLGIYSLKNNLNFSHSQAYSTLLGWPIFYLLYLWLLSLYPDIRDFYDDNDQFTVTNKERNAYNSFLEGLEDWEREVLDRAVSEDLNYYILELSNKGGLVMPVILEMEYADGSKEEMRLPAEIWRRNAKQVKKLIVSENELRSVAIDPMQETADADIENNYYPRRIIPSRIESFKSEGGGSLIGRDVMQDIKTQLKTDDDEQDN
jgi:hypothetical protein|tara:strand:- start:77 stop:706 length:630 start_codon:yes stop_codon:yes gene_type:complete